MSLAFHVTRRFCAVASAAQTCSRASSISSNSSSDIKPVMDIPVYLKPSSNPERKPSFYIPRMREEKTPSHLIKADGLGTAHPLFTISSSSCEYYALRLPLLKAGFKRVVAPATSAHCNLIWGRSMPFRTTIERDQDGTSRAVLCFPEPQSEERAAQLKALSMACNRQRFNHFPLSHRNIGCKKGLCKNVRRIIQSCSDSQLHTDELTSKYAYVPRTWFFPEEEEALFQEFRASPTKRFIWKPARGSCGRGIFFSEGGSSNSKSWERVAQEIRERMEVDGGHMYKQYVVQEYIDKPLLLEGRKMDLRLYVAVTSYDPLVVYLHDDGLVRLAAEQYEGPNMGFTSSSKNHSVDMFKHLTNFSVGRKHSKYMKDDTQGSSGTINNQDGSITSPTAETAPQKDLELKWSLQRLWDYMDVRYNDRSGTPPSVKVREEIALSIVRTLMAVQSPIRLALNRVRMPGGYFEVYGFDIMLQNNLTPVLLEVNTLPSLESSSPFDYAAKSNMMADLLNLSMMEPFEREEGLMADISSNRKLLIPPSREMLPWLHTLKDQENSMLLTKHTESMKDIEYRLEDEFRSARGFRRLFPPPSPSSFRVCPLSSEDVGNSRFAFPLSNDMKCVQQDINLYEKLGLLSPKDRWALALQ